MQPLDPIALAQALIRCPSVTPADAGALDVVQSAAEPLGFACRRLRFAEGGLPEIDNLYARLGDRGPVFCFAGHTDVVPPGDRALWSVDPFAAEIRNGILIGRGACDMKGALAAFLAAASAFVRRRGMDFGGSIVLLITGDEEAEAVNGTAAVLRWMEENGERLDACLVGEPTSRDAVGDTVKIGRRGSLTADLTVHGVQGHVAYPALADNAANRMARMLCALLETPLDAGTPHFDPSNLEVTTIDIGNPASNVIPAEARARFNIRFNDAHSGSEVERWVRRRLDAAGGDYTLTARISAESFITAPGPLSALVEAAVAQITGDRPTLSTSGGTSDARFIKDMCPVVELGLVGRTIHSADEQAALSDIERLTRIYEAVLEGYFSAG